MSCRNGVDLNTRSKLDLTLGQLQKIYPDILQIKGTVKLTDAETIARAQHVSSQQRFSYAAVSVAVISRQICHLWAISWR
jgi:hypothetical protein